MNERLGQIASIRMGYPFRSRLEHDMSGQVAVIQMKDIDDENRLHPETAIRVQRTDIKNHHLLREGDLVFKSRGSSNTAAMVSKVTPPAVLAAPMLLLRPMQVHPAYLLWYLNLPATQAALANQAEGTSVRMISKAALEDLEVPLPDRNKQQLIAETAQLAADEYRLMQQLTQKRRHLADGILLRYARDSR